MTRKRIAFLALAVMALAACEAETQLEPTPRVLIERAPNVCPGDHLSQGDTVSGDWGTASGISNGVNYEVHSPWTVTVCSKGGPDYNIATVTGPTSGFLQTPENAGGNVPALSHFSVTDITSSEPQPATTTTLSEDTTTTAAQETTLPEAAVTTTSIVTDGTTTIVESQPGESTTTVTGGTSTTGAGEVGQAGEEPTTTTAEQSTTSRADTQTTTAPDTDETLAYTGSSGVIGLGYLFTVGAVLVLLGWGVLRRRSE